MWPTLIWRFADFEPLRRRYERARALELELWYGAASARPYTSLSGVLTVSV
jgi:hypothetical protein